jgi:hypothetical protein
MSAAAARSRVALPGVALPEADSLAVVPLAADSLAVVALARPARLVRPRQPTPGRAQFRNETCCSPYRQYKTLGGLGGLALSRLKAALRAGPAARLRLAEKARFARTGSLAALGPSICVISIRRKRRPFPAKRRFRRAKRACQSQRAKARWPFPVRRSRAAIPGAKRRPFP